MINTKKYKVCSNCKYYEILETTNEIFCNAFDCCLQIEIKKATSCPHFELIIERTSK